MPPAPKNADTSADQWEAVGWMAGNIGQKTALIRKTLDGLDLAAFTSSGAAHVLRALREVCQRDAPSMAELTAELRRRPAPDDYNIGTLAQAMQQTAGIHERFLQAAAARITEAHAQRRFGSLLTDALATDLDPAARQAIIEQLAAVGRSGPDADGPATDAVSVAARWAEDDDERLIPTGFSILDRRFGGGLPAGITAICGMPGTGKSAMAGMLLLGSLLEDRKLRAIWFRGEMSDRLLWSRFLATWSTIRSPAVDRITRKEASRRSKAARAVNADLANVVGDRLQIIGAPLTAERMAAAIKRHRPDVVVVDYLQRTSAAGFQDRRSELDHVLGVVSDLTTELDLATIVVSSMSKGTNGGADIGGLTKESNRLDFDAHNYLALWSDKKDRDRDPRPVRLEIAKGRTGGEGSLDLWFSGSAQSFTPQAADGYEDQAERCTDFDAYSVEAAR
jgi:replicative DNA helicase